MRSLRAAAFAAAVLASGAAGAHELSRSADAPPGWTLDPWILAPLFASLFVFAIGGWRLAARSRLGRAALHRRAVLFGAGWLALAGALVSPLHEAGERSFTAHMFEHEVLMLVAAPLLVLSEPLGVMLWSFPFATRRAIGRAGRSRPLAATWRVLTDPVTATLVQAAALWLWHMPTLFDRALASNGWHIAQHLSFLVSALLFWTAMLRHSAGGSRVGAKVLAAMCLFVTSLVSGALGAIMAFSQSPWYAGYARLGMAPFGLTPTEDQQMAGLLMWVPGGLVHAGAALALVAAALKTPLGRLGVADAV